MKQPRTYTAPHPVYTGGVLYRAGRPFTTDEPRGAAWEPVNPAWKARAAGREEGTA